jgi:hypothetical protein
LNYPLQTYRQPKSLSRSRIDGGGLLHDIVLELQADLQAVAAKLRRIAEPQPDDVVPLRTPSRP